jgi:hypothetical protein
LLVDPRRAIRIKALIDHLPTRGSKEIKSIVGHDNPRLPLERRATAGEPAAGRVIANRLL